MATDGLFMYVAYIDRGLLGETQRLMVFRSRDGAEWETIAQLDAPGIPLENLCLAMCRAALVAVSSNPWSRELVIFRFPK